MACKQAQGTMGEICHKKRELELMLQYLHKLSFMKLKLTAQTMVHGKHLSHDTG